MRMIMEETAERRYTFTDYKRACSEGGCGAFRPTDLHVVLDDAFALFRPSLRDTEVRLFLDYAPDLPHIPADAAALRQAVLHLARNAVQAMPAGGLLYVATEALPGAPGGVRVRMRDTGTGIAPEILPHIFEPFFTTRPFGQAAGLGLAITRAIMRDHEGDITLQTAPERGTTVTLIFPTAVAVSPPERVWQLAA